MTVIRNNAPGMRGVNTEDQGPVMLAPGETRDLKVSERELESVKAMGLEIDPEQRRGEGEEAAPGTEDTSVTATPLVGSTVHPMPPGSDITQPEEALPSGALVAPWAVAGGTGSAAQTPDQLPGGKQSAQETADQQKSDTVANRQTKVEGTEETKRGAAKGDK